jgi:hypothetical protein
VLNGGDTIAYAWGQSLGRYRGLETWSHGGSWAGYRTTLLRFPEQGFAVVILANFAEMNPAGMANLIADLYLADDFPEGVPVAAQPPQVHEESWHPSVAELEEYASEYRSDELLTSWRLEVVDGDLVARHFRKADVRLTALAHDRFRGDPFGEVRFLRDETGQITAFTANQPRVRGLRFVRVR